MNIYHNTKLSSFNNEILKNLDKTTNEIKNKFGLNSTNALKLIVQKILEFGENGTYVECGVFQGKTLLNIAQFLKNENFNFNLIGVDSFEGFPDNVIDHKFDQPSYFTTLFEKKQISKDHYLKAVERTNDLKYENHLTNDYFKNVSDLFENVKQFSNIKLIKTKFSDIKKEDFNEISILFIDCDLYQSYLQVLDSLYDKVMNNGVIIFDEYYSLKYPGALVAVNEFFLNKKGTFEKYITSEGFERWAFIKN